MQKIGLTGGIGSGKTTVARVFENLGVPVYYADLRAKEIVDTDEFVKEKIISAMGDVYENGKLNRPKVAKIVFNNKEKLNQLNSIVHPAVRNDFLSWCESHSDKKFVIEEAAILFESGADKFVDKTIMVYAPEEIRIERVCKRDQVDRASVKARIKNQMPDKEKLRLADFVIKNYADYLVVPQVIEIYDELNSI